ncbi:MULTISPECIES: protein kinase [Streptomycetaceae]|uniref:protein kinase domain-containing protein n=1 Tax=Streptomycetaceae TaxID=2062 RepID=UPI00093FA284|nr:protein kinase [Streptomyces sp. CB02056]OKI06921.1 serine/threonine protein kinase [Streptomyces sp. CB02056]
MSEATVVLHQVGGPGTGDEHVFTERTTCLLGRAAECMPRLPDDERHRTVSRHHCLLDINPPDIRIRDFGSLNGTYVNGRKIGQRARNQSPEEGAALDLPEHDLADGDEIRIGDTVFRVGRSAPTLRLRPARCAACGRDTADEADGRDGSYVCATCRAEPGMVLRQLLALARQGGGAVASLADYELSAQLGRGGMGTVHLARHRGTGREVALKLMLPKVAASTRARALFLREVAVTRTLHHPNIVTLHEVGFAGGTFFFTLEYCRGGSVEDLLGRRGGRLPADEAVPLALQALAGLAHAHAAGVVHRDLSPGNLLLDHGPDGRPVTKVADFGLAKAFDQAGLSGLTRTGTTAGKPSCMPRQQIVNFRYATPEVDVWGLAACLYRMLTGRYPRPFPPGTDPWQVVLQTPATPLREVAPHLPRRLAEVVDQALREQPAIGFPDAAAFAAALREAL